jgi:hypothetical protein
MIDIPGCSERTNFKTIRSVILCLGKTLYCPVTQIYKPHIQHVYHRNLDSNFNMLGLKSLKNNEIT